MTGDAFFPAWVPRVTGEAFCSAPAQKGGEGRWEAQAGGRCGLGSWWVRRRVELN